MFSLLFCYTTISSCCLDTLRCQYPLSFCGPAVFGLLQLLYHQLLFFVKSMMMVMVLAVLSNSQKMVPRMTYHTLPLVTLGFKTMCAGGTDCLADDANCIIICSFFTFSPLLLLHSYCLTAMPWCMLLLWLAECALYYSLLNFDSMVCTQVLCYILATCI